MSDQKLIEVDVNMKPFEEALKRLARSTRDLRPAMRDIGGLLEKETFDNFRAQGRPAWKPLSQVTIINRLMSRDKNRKRKGVGSVFRKNGEMRARARRMLEGGLAILQDSGDLRNSVQAYYPDPVSVIIGSDKTYAAIHQFGGKAGRNRKVRIPARPYIPVDADGNLAPEAERGVLAAIYEHLARSV